ncbi:uncharacterized protein LOC113128181 isoform X3 [Mastacembelus armatus]|uniref:uncharacterized protein LOC113128181 isoform X3 n=1 Tax=Mastacembelus armatus TaxID=205130 RepID=UPI000E45A436|nr:uncharacterized protein LOC113128181 isoform X3 [Mastacembelus armatus]
MEHQLFLPLFFKLTWIFVVFFPSVCSGTVRPQISLENTVFVAIRGEDLSIKCDLRKPANQSADVMICSSPSHKQIYRYNIPSTIGIADSNYKLILGLKNLTSSGQYYCEYQTAKAYWFLRVRDEEFISPALLSGYDAFLAWTESEHCVCVPDDGYHEPKMWDYTEVIIVAVFTGVLLVFSVVGSVYVFRGHWQITKCDKSDRQQKQNKERKEREIEKEDNADVTPAPSTSFYASLEPRPRSIYDVLDHSAANTEPDQQKAKPKKKEPSKTNIQTSQHQDKGIFESVYENF